MSSQVYGVRVIRWSLKSAAPCISKYVPVTETNRIPVSVMYRTLCTARHDRGSNPLIPAQKKPEKKLSIQSLTEMGFSETQAKTVYEGANENGCKSGLCILTSLFGLGLNPDSVVKIMEKCPELYSVKGPQLQQRIENLRKLGLIEGSLQRVLSHFPQLLRVPVKQVTAVAHVFREKCLFTAQQVADILRDTPAVVQEDLVRLQYMFQYVYFRMGCGHADMVKAKLFRISLAELQCRHGFLERRGLYQTPDKKGQTRILNPPLKDILAVSMETYLTKVAVATQEEFDVFRKLLARELEEQGEEGEEYSSDDDDDKGDDDDDDDKDEVHIKNNQTTGYNKRKKQHWHK